MTLKDISTGPDWILWVVFGILAAISIVLLSGHGANLIAGYNTAGKEEKSKYDAKKLCRVTGAGMAVITILILVMAAGENVLPVSVKISNITKLEAKTYTMTSEEARKKLTAEIDEIMRLDLHGLEITDTTVTFTETELGLYCRYDCTVIDDIAEPQTIHTEFTKRKTLHKD